MAATDAFKHSTPELYDRLMGPLLFQPWANVLASRAAEYEPQRILETAAGTGIVTEALHRVIPAATIVATDINPAMLGLASRRVQSNRVSFQQADAQNLPFHEEFDLTVCQFGAMFFPDRPEAHRQARRALRQGGRYLLLTFDRLDRNPVPEAAGRAVGSLFADDPHYMERGPFSYSDPDLIRADLQTAGFEDVRIETLMQSSRVNADDAATGIVLGSPFRAEIETLGPSALQHALDAVKKALNPWDGEDAPMSAHLASCAR